MFGFEEGWAASHCQIGALAPLQALVFDWLDKAVNKPGSLPKRDLGTLFEVMKKYMHSGEEHAADESVVR
ncbi:hypothetical protein TFLX_00575 [Thermoflexales bacterium]|nr:hypothetical protein TFLX_00575 [Thermoflexales bacterium]